MNSAIYLGRYQDVLADVTCDAVICDPPYGPRTHGGHNGMTERIARITGQRTRRPIQYASWTDRDVAEFVAFWAHRCRGWICAMTSHDLIGAWEAELSRVGRYVFAPVGVLIYHPRLIGDGPGSGLVYMIVARPKTRQYSTWGALPPWYGPYYPATERGHIGGKPKSLMISVVSDYSRPGDVVCDPCAGYGTTLVAARQMGRRWVGAEVDPDTHAQATTCLAGSYHTTLLDDGVGASVQEQTLPELREILG